MSTTPKDIPRLRAQNPRVGEMGHVKRVDATDCAVFAIILTGHFSHVQVLPMGEKARERTSAPQLTVNWCNEDFVMYLNLRLKY